MRRKIKGPEGLTTSLWGVLVHDPPPACGEGAGGVGTPPLACGEGAGGGRTPPPSMWCGEKGAPLPGSDVRLLQGDGMPHMRLFSSSLARGSVLPLGGGGGAPKASEYMSIGRWGGAS